MPYDMRVLHIIGSMDPSSGGPCQGIRNSALMLEQLNVYREVVCFDDSDAAYLGNDIFPITALGQGLTPWKYNSRLIPWLEANLHRFDAVVTNGLWLYHSTATRLVIERLRKKMGSKTAVPRRFVMPHGMLDPYFQRASTRKLKSIRNWIYWQLLEQKVVSQADGLLFTCETELLLARTTFKPYAPKRELNISYGVEAPPAYSETMRRAFLEKCPEVADKPYLLFLSRIHQKKGVDLLVEAFLEFTLENVGNPGHLLPALVIAGPGIESAFGELLCQTIQAYSGMLPRIYFPGMLTGEAKWGAFYGAEAFVLPSHQENFGIAVAEALSCGTPVLISNQVNIWREIEVGGGGIVAPDTLQGTIQLLLRWIELSKESKKLMGEKAKATYKQHYAIELAAILFKEAVS